jgi:hypothetical protein
MVWSCRMGEDQTRALRSSNESWSDSRRRFRGTKMFVHFCSSCMGGVFPLDEVSSFKMYLLFPLFESPLPLVEVPKLPLQLNKA